MARIPSVLLEYARTAEAAVPNVKYGRSIERVLKGALARSLRARSGASLTV